MVALFRKCERAELGVGIRRPRLARKLVERERTIAGHDVGEAWIERAIERIFEDQHRAAERHDDQRSGNGQPDPPMRLQPESSEHHPFALYFRHEPQVTATVTPDRPKGRVPRFSISRQTRAFRREFFPDADDHSWNDWRWQLRHSLRGLEALERVLHLSDDERAGLQRNRNSLPNAITPYYASLLDRSDASDPLRRTMVMASQEFERTPEESIDPLHEDEDSPVPGLVHRYPDRVLFLATGTCPVYCRY